MSENKLSYSIIRQPVSGEFKDDAYFIARDEGGGEIGNALGKRTADNALKIVNLYVSEDSRQLGIGGDLLQRLLDWGKEQGLERVSGNFRPGTSIPHDEIVEWYKKRGIDVTGDNQLTGIIK